MALTQIQPNLIDSANSFSMTNLAVTGNLTVTGNVVGNVYGSQGNITSLGTLTSLTVNGPATFQQTADILQIKAGATGTVVHDVTLGGVFHHTGVAANFTANFTNMPITNNRATLLSLVIVQGTTPYVPNAVQIEGTAYTIKWLGGNAPTGNASKTDVISFSFLRASNSWTILAQISTFL